jgi:hypothetical protein
MRRVQAGFGSTLDLALAAKESLGFLLAKAQRLPPARLIRNCRVFTPLSSTFDAKTAFPVQAE